MYHCVSVRNKWGVKCYPAAAEKAWGNQETADAFEHGEASHDFNQSQSEMELISQ